ncbi:MAG: DotA/TraY family protein [Coxiellaceae bacterium]|nr:DotA/TraY family protein [Coxiellaceae bacterium]
MKRILLNRVMMNRLLSVLTLWSLSVFALADSAPSFPNSTQSATDMSVKYLGQIFGNVPGVLSGTGGGLMGKLFYVFNQGILAAAVIYLVFNVTMILLHMGTDAQASGKFNHHKILFRVAIGMALIIPGSNTGYSASQDLMMKVVLEGTQLADVTWNYALDYLSTGGLIYDPATSKDQIKSASALNAYMKPIQLQAATSTVQQPHSGIVDQVFKDEVCMVLSNNQNKIEKESNAIAKENANDKYHMIQRQPEFESDGKTLKPGTGGIYFPGFGNPSRVNATTDAIPPHNCGSLMIDSTKWVGAKTTSMQYQEAYAAVNQMAIDILPLAKAQANSYISQGSKFPMGYLSGGKVLSRSILDYLHLMKPVANNQTLNTTAVSTQFVPFAKAQGWFNAGAYYWNLAHLNDALAQGGKAETLTPLVKGPSEDVTTLLGNKITIVDRSLGNPVPTDIWGAAIKNINDFITAGTGGSKITAVNTDSNTGGADLFGIVGSAMHSVTNVMQQSMAGAGAYDPLVMVQNIGRSCLSAAGSIWEKSLIASMGFAVGAGICTSASPGGTIFGAMQSWTSVLWTASSGALFAAGFMLTVYAPMYPYLLFMFGVVGWLIAVIEAMIAAPLVCFGMTHPEGHDFMGRSEQALMLALGVFLRPALMVVGYLSGVLLSYVGFTFVNTVIGGVFVNELSTQPAGNYTPLSGIYTAISGKAGGEQGSHLSGHSLVDFFCVILLLMFYGMIAMEVVNQCFSAIHVIPDQVLRWIGAPVQQSDAAGRADKMKGALQGGASKAGQMGAQTSEAMGKAGGGLALAAGGGKAKDGASDGVKDLNSSGDAGGAGEAAAGA